MKHLWLTSDCVLMMTPCLFPYASSDLTKLMLCGMAEYECFIVLLFTNVLPVLEHLGICLLNYKFLPWLYFPGMLLL